MPKNTFFENTKKIFCAKIFLGLFVHVQRWLVQKKNTGSQCQSHLKYVDLIFYHFYHV